jgi:hypothetical protein
MRFVYGLWFVTLCVQVPENVYVLGRGEWGGGGVGVGSSADDAVVCCLCGSAVHLYVLCEHGGQRYGVWSCMRSYAVVARVGLRLQAPKLSEEIKPEESSFKVLKDTVVVRLRKVGAHTRTRARTHTHTDARARTLAHIYTRGTVVPRRVDAYTRARTKTYAHIRAHTQTRAYGRTQARAHTCTRETGVVRHCKVPPRVRTHARVRVYIRARSTHAQKYAGARTHAYTH